MKNKTNIYVIMSAAALMITVGATRLLTKNDKVSQIRVETEQTTMASNRNWEIAKAKEDPLRAWNEGEETGQTSMKTVMTHAEQRPYEIEYPPIISVSKNKDTLVWDNGVYVKVDDILPPSQDTIIVGGRKFIEIKEDDYI